LGQALRGGSKDLGVISDLSRAPNSEMALEELIAFLSAGFRAPLTHAFEEAHAAIEER